MEGRGREGERGRGGGTEGEKIWTQREKGRREGERGRLGRVSKQRRKEKI